MLKALFSSGTLLKVGVRLDRGLLKLSIEFCRELPLVDPVSLDLASLRCWLCRSISSYAVSNVKSVKAWNLFRERKMA